MRLEGHDRGDQPARRGFLAEVAQDGLVPEVDAVEVADGERTGLSCRDGEGASEEL